MEYKVITSKTLDWLTIYVNKELEKGWVCQGGVSVSFVAESKYQKPYQIVSQAMVFTKPK